jgi:hypothetical protein
LAFYGRDICQQWKLQSLTIIVFIKDAKINRNLGLTQIFNFLEMQWEVMMFGLFIIVPELQKWKGANTLVCKSSYLHFVASLQERKWRFKSLAMF